MEDKLDELKRNSKSKSKRHHESNSLQLTPTASKSSSRPITTTKRKAELLTMAVLGFRTSIKSRKNAFLIPKDSQAWIDHLTQLIRKHADIKYMVDSEIEKVIKRWRITTVAKQEIEPVIDPDLPESYYWTEEQVGEWVQGIGYPQYKHAFLNNHITGRKLITVDANGLNRMGIQQFNHIKALAGKIRDVLHIHRPNILRALIRLVPFEKYLLYRSKTGPNSSASTFEAFCTKFGFPYEVLKANKCALISCVCDVLIQKAGTKFDEDSEGGSDDVASDASLNYAPSVEFTVRHVIVRNKLINQILDAMIGCVFEDPEKRKYGYDTMAITIREIMEWGYNELFTKEEILEKIEFAKSIAHEMLAEVKRTALVLQDIQHFQRFLKSKNVSDPADQARLKEIAETFVEEVASLATLLAFGEFEIENIFRQEPEFNQFVDGIVHEAEEKTNALVPVAEILVDQVISEARLKVTAMDFPNLSLEAVRSAKDLALQLLDEMLKETFEFVEYYESGDEYEYNGEDEAELRQQQYQGTASSTSTQRHVKNVGRSVASTRSGQQPSLRSKKGKQHPSMKLPQYSKDWKEKSRGHRGRDERGADYDRDTDSTSAYNAEGESYEGESNYSNAAGTLKKRSKSGKVLMGRSARFDSQGRYFPAESSEESSRIGEGYQHHTGGSTTLSEESGRISSSEGGQRSNQASRSKQQPGMSKKSPGQLKEIDESTNIENEFLVERFENGHSAPGEGSGYSNLGSASIVGYKYGKPKFSRVGKAYGSPYITNSNKNSSSSSNKGSGDGSPSSVSGSGEHPGEMSDNRHKHGHHARDSSSQHSQRHEKQRFAYKHSMRLDDGTFVEISPNQSDADINAGTPTRRTRGIQNDADALSTIGQRRAELAERWAQSLDPVAHPSKSKVGEDRARLIRIMADQVAADVSQMALTHLLLEAEAGQDTSQIMQTLQELQVPAGQGSSSITQTRLWTPHLGRSSAHVQSRESRTGETAQSNAPSSRHLPQPIRPKRIVPLKSSVRQIQRPQQTVGARTGRQVHPQQDACPTTQCPNDMICYYPYFQSWRKY